VGQAIALGLAEAGCDLALHYHGAREGAEATARDVRAAGRRAVLLQADLRDAAAARVLADQAAAPLGGLDIVVNSAGIMVHQPIEDVTPESWDATFDVNLRAYFFVAQGDPAPPAVRGRTGISPTSPLSKPGRSMCRTRSARPVWLRLPRRSPARSGRQT
jgi:NAD(P)-dependent dehydrogenase (short-subunit alcohol dehydrogenase family)